MPNVLVKTQYTRLREELRGIISEGKARLSRIVQSEIARMYWHVGKRLAQADLSRQAHYGDSIMEDLAEELEIEITTLRDSVLFFQQYKNRVPQDMNLPWSHYRHLMRIADQRKRKYYEDLAVRRGLTRDQLVRAIQGDGYAKREDTGHPPGGEAGKTQDTRKKLKRPTKVTYVYKALVERVIDGDTLLLRIDLGFTVWKEQRVRLARIDTEPLETAKGHEAFEFVRDRMARAKAVVVRTNKIDIYGRYVGDLFYTLEKRSFVKVFEEGNYLNQELLDEGLAKVF